MIGHDVAVVLVVARIDVPVVAGQEAPRSGELNGKKGEQLHDKQHKCGTHMIWLQ
jgi:hypothetical protein